MDCEESLAAAKCRFRRWGKLFYANNRPLVHMVSFSRPKEKTKRLEMSWNRVKWSETQRASMLEHEKSPNLVWAFPLLDKSVYSSLGFNLFLKLASLTEMRLNSTSLDLPIWWEIRRHDCRPFSVVLQMLLLFENTLWWFRTHSLGYVSPRTSRWEWTSSYPWIILRRN